jgi:DNA-binding response OmpR family regulator
MLEGVVLVVDDDELVRELVVLLLQQAGFLALRAADAEEARARAEEHGGAIDLLVTDAALPGESGLELAARLVLERPRLAVLLVTGQPESVELRALALHAVVDLLPKPFTPDELLRRVRRLLDLRP